MRLLSRQDGRCSLCGENLITPDQPPQTPEGWERWFLRVTKKAIEADYLAHHDTPRAARSKRTHLVHATCEPEQANAPAGGQHRDAADDLNRPSGLPGPRARERACVVLRGPRHGNVPGLPGDREAGSPRRAATDRGLTWMLTEPSDGHGELLGQYEEGPSARLGA